MTADLDDPDLSLVELFRRWPEATGVFCRHGTACVGCPIAPFHTLRDTCAEYRLDEAALRAALRRTVRAARAPSNHVGLSGNEAPPS